MSGLVPLELVAAIDIGGTNTVFALVSREGEIIVRDSIATNSISDFDEYVAAITNRMNAMSGQHKVLAVGIGAPNGNYFNGTIEFAPNLPWRGVLQLPKSFNKYMVSKHSKILKRIAKNDCCRFKESLDLLGASTQMYHLALGA